MSQCTSGSVSRSCTENDAMLPARVTVLALMSSERRPSIFFRFVLDQYDGHLRVPPFLLQIGPRYIPCACQPIAMQLRFGHVQTRHIPAHPIKPVFDFECAYHEGSLLAYLVPWQLSNSICQPLRCGLVSSSRTPAAVRQSCFEMPSVFGGDGSVHARLSPRRSANSHLGSCPRTVSYSTRCTRPSATALTSLQTSPFSIPCDH